MTIICVAGMHRSGTSMVARGLNLCGIHLGAEKEFLPAASDNPEGFWENINFISINEKILSIFKSTWDNPPSLDPGWELSNPLDECRQDAERLIMAMEVHEHWGWKDPRTSLTLPFWRQLIPNLKVVICLRNPLEVAQSLIHRNGFPPEISMRLWQAYNEALLSNPPENQLITHYNSYFMDAQAELQRLLDFAGMAPDALMVKKACEATIPSLRHNRATVESLLNVGASLEVATLYAGLCVQSGPVYWDSSGRKLQTGSDAFKEGDNVVETGLVLGLIEKNPAIHSLAGHISEKEQMIQSLAAQIRAKDTEISAQVVEAKKFKDLMTLIPAEALKLFVFCWRIFKLVIPHNSRRERFTNFLAKGSIKIYRKLKEREYQNWISKYDLVSEQDRSVIARRIEMLEKKPLISVLMPVYNPPLRYLDEAIRSVKDQVYAHWELCIADDASPNYLVRALIEKHAKDDSRIRYVFRENNGHISAASNSALALATGEYIALLDHDDVLHPLALYHVAEEINKDPGVEVIYSDEDILNEGEKRISPYFKPDFDYDLLTSQNMVSHLGVYRAETIKNIGGFRLGFEGSQDYDLVLRIIEKIEPDQIRHIPRVLYHWRVSDQSAASGADAKPYAYEASLHALKDHLSRKKIDAFVEFVPGTYSYRVRYSTPQPHPSVSIIIYAPDFSSQLERCVDSILSHTRYSNYNILLYLGNNLDGKDQAAYKRWSRENRVSVIRNAVETSQSQLINRAVMNSQAEYICLLDEKTDGFFADWLGQLVGVAAQAGIGATGPLLLQPNDKIFSGGVILTPDKVTVQPFSGLPKYSAYHGWAMLQKGYSAISDACLLVRRSHFLDVGGFNETLLTRYYATVDLCLKLREKGLRNIITPVVELYHHRDNIYNKKIVQKRYMQGLQLEKDKKYIINHWQAWLNHDPAFNPNLGVKNGWIIPATPRWVKNNRK